MELSFKVSFLGVFIHATHRSKMIQPLTNIINSHIKQSKYWLWQHEHTK